MTTTASQPTAQPVIISTGGGDAFTKILTIALVGGGLFVGNKLYKDWKASQDTKDQNDAGKNSGDINYQMAQNLATLFERTFSLNASELANYQTWISQVTDGKKVREFYNAITKTRFLDNDVAKWIPANNQNNANKNITANADAYSTYKVNAAGKAISNVNTGDLILPKGAAFKLYKDWGAETMKKILWSQIAAGTALGQWQSTGKSFYVGEVIEFTATWYVDKITGKIGATDWGWGSTKHTQEKVFFKIWGVDDKNWYWVDAVEFKRAVARTNGLSIGAVKPFQFA